MPSAIEKEFEKPKQRRKKKRNAFIRIQHFIEKWYTLSHLKKTKHTLLLKKNQEDGDDDDDNNVDDDGDEKCTDECFVDFYM